MNPQNSRKPRPVLEHRNGAMEATNPLKEGVPVAKIPEQPATPSDADALMAALDAALQDAYTALYALDDQPPEVALPQLHAGLVITRRCLQAVS